MSQIETEEELQPNVGIACIFCHIKSDTFNGHQFCSYCEIEAINYNDPITDEPKITWISLDKDWNVSWYDNQTIIITKHEDEDSYSEDKQTLQGYVSLDRIKLLKAFL